MKKIYSILLLSFLFNLYGQEYFSEDFNGGEIPTTWEVINTNSIENWEISLQQPDGGYLAIVTGSPSGGQCDEWLITPEIDLSEAINPSIYFEGNYSTYFLITENLADYLVYYTLDNGENWEQIWVDSDGYLEWDYNTQMAIHNVSVPELAGEESVKFAFRLLTEQVHTFDYSVWLDNIVVGENDFEPVESVEITGPNEIIIGDYIQLEALVLPENSNQGVVWSVTEGDDIVSVDSFGYVYSIAVGTAIVRATSNDNSEIFDEIEINVIEDPFNDGCNQRFSGVNSSFFSIYSGLERVGASDFIIPAGIQYSLETFTPSLMPGQFSDYDPSEFNTFNVEIRSDDNGAPGEILHSFEDITYSSYDGEMVYNVNFDFPEPILLSGGEDGIKYWVTLSATPTTSYNILWAAYPYSENSETSYSYRSEDNGITWNPVGFEGEEGNYELVFDIAGTCTELEISEQLTNELVVYPNPSSGKFSIQSSEKVESLELYDVSGKLIRSFLSNRTEYNINDLSKGVYILKIKSEGREISTQKIIKK